MLRSIGSNWSLNALQIVVFMVLTPFISNTIGNDAYGTWEIIVAWTGILQLLSLGLPMATVRALSAAVARKDGDAASKALGTSLSLTLVLGVVATILGSGVYYYFTQHVMQGPNWDSTSAALQSDTVLALAIMLGNVALSFALKLPYAVFDAHQDFLVRNLVMAAGLFSKLAASIVLLSWRADLPTLAAVQVGIAALEFLIAMLVSKRRHPLVRFRPTSIDPVEAKGLLSFSVFAFLLNTGAMLAFRIDAIVIGDFLKASDAAIYGYGNKIFDPFIGILLGIAMVLMPMAATESSKGNMDRVRDEFLKWSKISTTIVMLMGGYLIVLGPQFLEAWLGDVYSPISGRVLRILMASFFVFLPIRGVALPVLMGLGKPKVPGFGLLAMGITNLCLSLALVRPYGIIGVAFGTAIPNVLFSLLFLREACKRLDLSIGEWLKYTLGRLLPATILCASLLALVSSQVHISGYPRVVGAGIAYTALFGVLALSFVYRGDRFVDASALIARIKDKLP